jgi:hypothetical protein
MLDLSLSMIAAKNFITQKLKTGKEVAIINNSVESIYKMDVYYKKKNVS